MGNLIKMDLRRLFHSPMFYISVAVVAVLNIVLNIFLSMIVMMFAGASAAEPSTLSSYICSPFFLPLFIILMLASMVSFTYADTANGYIKNLAGQIKRKSDTIISKFVAVGVHNLVFLVVGAVTNVFSTLVVSGMGAVKIVMDTGNIPAACLTLLLKWMLSMAICSILMFVTVGIKNKTVASIVGVIFGTGSLGFAYMGLNAGIANIFHTDGFDLNNVMPDSLINSVNVLANTAVVNAVIVSIVCTAIFLAITVKVFNSRDVK